MQYLFLDVYLFGSFLWLGKSLLYLFPNKQTYTFLLCISYIEFIVFISETAENLLISNTRINFNFCLFLKSNYWNSLTVQKCVRLRLLLLLHYFLILRLQAVLSLR